MALIDILTNVYARSGLSASQRSLVLTKINEAAKEIYSERDLPGTLQECYVRVTNDEEMALPPFIGKLRAIRSTEYNDRWTLKDLTPRYMRNDWPEKWNGFRVKHTSPVCREITNSAPGTIEYPVVDSELVISFNGITEDSNRAIDTVTMNSTEETWTKSYLQFRSITKNKVTDYDVVIKDVDGNEIAVIYADQLEARYQIIDVSAYPNIQGCSDGTFAMEILYKQKLPVFSEDKDVFPVPDYDDVIVLKTLQLLAEDKEGQEQKAILMDQKAQRTIQRLQEDSNGVIQKKLSFGKRKFRNIYSGAYGYR